MPWAWLEAVHDGGLLERIRAGELTLRESRWLGLPWSAELVERGRRAVGGTVAAARFAVEHGIGMNLGGGTHHAGRDFARGYCLFNDVAVALRVLRSEGLAERALVVDCDVHQGDGTAHLLAADDAPSRSRSTARATTRSSGSRPTSTSTSRRAPATTPTWRRSTRRSTPRSRARGPTSPSTWPAPTRGRATGSAASLSPRPACAAATASSSTACPRSGASICVALGGGYAHHVRDTLEINAATSAAVARRLS